MRFVYDTFLTKVVLERPAQGADARVWLAASTPGNDWTPGAYYEKRKRAKANDQAYNAHLAHALWEASEAFTQSRSEKHDINPYWEAHL